MKEITPLVEKFDDRDNMFVFKSTSDLLKKFPENKILKLCSQVP